MSPATHRFEELLCYAPSAALATRAIHVRVLAEDDGSLRITYTVAADVERLRIPAARAPARADGLWRHTCLEAFITTTDSPAYIELNFSPSGEWALYHFNAYREGMRAVTISREPVVVVRQTEGQLEVEARVPAEALALVRFVAPQKSAGVSLHVALAAVMEDIDGVVSYWALRHPAAKADFHHPDSFVLELPP